MIFIDANYFLRLLIDDGSDLHRKAHNFFLDVASGKGNYMTSTLVMFEIYWVLKSYYQRNKTQLVSMIGALLKMDCIVLTDRLLFIRALARFSQSTLEFEDCFHLEIAKDAHCTGIATFDAKLARAFEG